MPGSPSHTREESKMGRYKKALKEIAELYWTADGVTTDEEVLEQIAQVIDRTDRTLWDKP